MAQDFNSMFGTVNPQDAEAAYLARQQVSPNTMAQLPLLNQVVAMGGNAGAGLGNSVGRMLGGQTSVEAEQALMKNIFSKAAAQSPDPMERLKIAAAEFDKIDPAKAQALRNEAAKFEQNAADTAAKQATTNKTRFDMSPAGAKQRLMESGKFTSPSIDAYVAGTGPLVPASESASSRSMGLLKGGNYTPESVASFVKGTGVLVPIDKLAKPPADFSAVAVELGFGEHAAFGDYSAEQTGKINATLQQRKEQARAAGKSSVTVTNAGEGELYKKALGGLGTDLVATKTAAQDATVIIQTNQTGRALLDSGMITGAGAEFLVSLNRGLAQAGMDFGYKDAAENSQAYAATMGANVGKLIKQFGSGTGLSDADRAYAEKMAAAKIALDEPAMRKILDINDRAARNSIKAHNEAVKNTFKGDQATIDKFSVEVPPAAPPEVSAKATRPQPASPAAFDANWKNMKPGETITGLDGKTYTKGK